MAVVPAYTKPSGVVVYKPAPTKADIQRAVSEKRVQTYREGKKVSDTSRVKVTVAGQDKWVTPEKALAVSRDEAKIAEAKLKIKRREELERTIKGRFEREVAEARAETERLKAEKKGIKLIKAEREREPTLGEKVRLSIFERQAEVRLKEARERGEPAEAVVTEEGFIVAPVTKKFYKGEEHITEMFPEEIPRLRKRKVLSEREKVIEEAKPLYERKEFEELQERIRRKQEVDIGKIRFPSAGRALTEYKIISGRQIIPRTAVYAPGFERQLGTGVMKDIFGVPAKGLGEERYWQYRAIGEQEIKGITPISKEIVPTVKKIWKKTEVIPKWTMKHLPPYEEERVELLYDPFTRKVRGALKEKLPGKIEEMERQRYTIYREEPRKALAYGAAFVALPFVLKGAGAIVSSYPLLRTTTEILTPAVTGLLAGSYIKGVKERVEKAERPWAEFGRIKASEIEPMIVGGYIGIRLANILEGRIRTRGLKRVPTEQIVEPEVISGEKMFPTSTRKHLKLFKESKFKLVDIEKKLGVWHASSTAKETGFSQIIRTEIGKTGLVGVGSEYLPGGFVSPSLSPYFLKVSGTPYTFMGTDLFPGTPTVAYIYPKGISQYKGRTVRGMWDFLFGKAKKGWVYTHRASIKTEVEGLIPPGTPIRGIDKRFYVKWEGVRVPIVEFTTKIGGAGKITTVGALPTIYVKPSIISPLGIGMLDILSKGKEYSTSEVSSRISSRVSSIISEDYSKLSSRISEMVSEKPSRVSKVSRISKLSSRISEVSSRIVEDRSIVSRVYEGISRVSRGYEKPYRYVPPPEEPPPPLIPFIRPRLYLGEPIKRKAPREKIFAFTPDFIASVLNQFGRMPKQRIFTGQERRFLIRGRRFVSPLPKVKNGGIFGLIRKQLEA